MNFDTKKDEKQYIELMKRFSRKIDEEIKYETLPLSEVNKEMYELNPETSYIEREEYNHLRYLIDTRLRDYEKEIIYMTFGFYDRCYSSALIAKKLKVPTRFVNCCRKEIILKLKKWIIDEDIVKKSSK